MDTIDTRTPRKGVTTTLVALALVAVTGCARTPEAEAPYETDARPQHAVIEVDNTDTAVGEMTVYLVPGDGVTKRLGTVTLDERATFEVTDANWGAQFALVADLAGTPQIVSRSFTLTRGDLLEWDLRLNNLHFMGSVTTGGGA